MKPLTVRELGKMCMQAIAGGYGDREILLATDDEGNFFREMYYGFTATPDDIRGYYESGCIEGGTDIDNVILLG